VSACPGGCQHTIGRLTREVVDQELQLAHAEIAKGVLDSRLAAATDRIDQLEHDPAMVAGPALVAEAEGFLAERGGGS
jgi:hypothetical protein